MKHGRRTGNFYIAAAMIAAVALCLATGGCVDRSRQGKYSPQQAQQMAREFPKKRIQLICPPKQGGLSDFITRTLSSYTEDAMGVNIIVQNRPGAAGATGMRFGAKARPDGYTVTYVTVESTILKHRKGIKDTVSHEDFDLLARLNYGPAALSVKADSDWEDFGDFVEYAQKNPGKIKVGNSGAFSIWHLASAAIADKLNIDLGYVPYNGAAPSVQDLLGGHIQAVVSSPSEVITFAQGGQLKMLAVFGEERDPEFPDVPTARELGFDVVVGAWGGLGVPKNTPDGIKKILIEKFKAGFDSEGFREKCRQRGVTLGWMDAAQFTEFAKNEDAMFGRVLEKLPTEDKTPGLSPMSFPKALLILIAVLAVVQLVLGVVKKDAQKKEGLGPRFGVMLIFFAVLAIYILALPYVGYLLSTVVFLGVCFLVLSPRRDAGALIGGAAFALVAGLAVYYLFAVFLSVPLIEGPVDEFVRYKLFAMFGG